MKKIQQWVYRTLFDVHGAGSLPHTLEKFINWLIVANLLAPMLEHIPTVHQGREDIFHDFDVASVIFFTVEYFLRLFAAPENPALAGKRFPRFRHAGSPFAIIDLLVIAPFWLHYAGIVELDLRALRGLRLLRLLKFLRDVRAGDPGVPDRQSRQDLASESERTDERNADVGQAARAARHGAHFSDYFERHLRFLGNGTGDRTAAT
jgi:hypothetical protein